MDDTLKIGIDGDEGLRKLGQINNGIDALGTSAKSVKTTVKSLATAIKGLSQEVSIDVAAKGVREADAAINAVAEKSRVTYIDIDIERYKDQLKAMGRAESEVRKHNRRRRELNDAFSAMPAKDVAAERAHWNREFADRDKRNARAARQDEIVKEKARKKDLADLENHLDAVEKRRANSRGRRQAAIKTNMAEIAQLRAREANQEMLKISNPGGGRDLAAEARKKRYIPQNLPELHGKPPTTGHGPEPVVELTEEMKKANAHAEWQREIRKTTPLSKTIGFQKAMADGIEGPQKDKEDKAYRKRLRDDNREANGGNRFRSSGGGGGDDMAIGQMPQNALMGRFAQWGMMASGAAASIFLVQMIGQQLGNLMDILMKWEDAVDKVTESFVMTDTESKKMSKTIRAYSRRLGISQAGAAEAVGAAGRYGLEGGSGNVATLHSLQKSDMIADYREAAMIMSLAGTKFGDNAATQYLKRGEADGRKGDEAGSFGFEWEALKGAGTEAMIHVFSGRDIEYGKSLTKTMMQISKWTNANRDFLGTGFDAVVLSLKAFYEVLEIALPALAAFSAYFVVSNSMKMFTWGLDGIAAAAGKLTGGIGTLGAAIGQKAGGLRWAMDGLGATTAALAPGLWAVGAAFAAWEIGSAVADVYRLNSALREAKELSKGDVADMSDAQVSVNINKNEGWIRSLEDKRFILEQQRKNAAMDDGGTSKAMKKYGVMGMMLQAKSPKQKGPDLAEEIKRYEKKIEEFEAANRILNEKEAASMNLNLPDNVPSVKEWAAGLERVNAEMGFMPAQLLKIKRAYREIDFDSLAAAAGGPFTPAPQLAAAMQAQTDFADVLASDPKAAGKHSTAKTQASLDANGFTQFESKIFDLNAMKAEQESQYGDNPAENAKISNTIAGLNTQLDVLATKNGADNLNKLATSLHGLKDAVKQMDMTAFQKEIYAIDKMDGDTSKLKTEKNVLLTDKLKKGYLRMQGKNPDLKGQKEDIKGSFLDQEIKDGLVGHLDSTEKLKGLEVQLNAEKAKGLEYATARSIQLERDIKNEKALDKWKNLHKTDQVTYDTAKAFNDEKARSDIRLTGYSQESLKGNLQSTNQGFLSKGEAKAKQDTTLEKLFRKINALPDDKYSDSAKQGMKDQAQQNQVRETLNDVNKSFLQFSTMVDKASGRGMSEDTENTRKDLVASNVRKMQEQNVDLDAIQGYERSTLFDIDQEKRSVNFEAWEQYYSDQHVMTAEHYKNEKDIIAENYAANQSKMGEHLAALLKKEEEYQRAKKNRRALPLGEDMAVAGKTVVDGLTDSYKTLGEMAERTMTKAFSGTANALTSMIMGTKDAKEAFKDMARSILADLVNMIIKQELYNMIVGQSGSPGGGGGGWLTQGLSFLGNAMFATGGVSRGISDYSNQIVSSPTFVPGGSRVTAYAKGGSLFGEAGPEAIMPLSRMSSGNLGVEVGGTGGGNSVPNIEIRIENNGKAVSAKQKEMKWDASQNKFICGIILEAATKNTGDFRTVLKGTLSV